MAEILNAADGYLKAEKIDEAAPSYDLYHEDAPSPIEGFLTQATLEAGDKNEGADADAVQLMTVHAAKGLEFDEVFIIGAEEGIFPHFSATRAADRRAQKSGLEEERRLMYVAITRAKRRLVITHCRERMMYGNHFANPISSFIDEIPQGLLDRRALPRENRWESEDSESWSLRRRGRAEDRGGSRSASGFGASSGFARSRQAASSAGAAASGAFGFKPGDAVEHQKFGRGTVLSVTGSNEMDARLRVKFSSAGVKELGLFFAKEKMRRL